MAIGSYVGDSTVDRDISISPSFQPDFTHVRFDFGVWIDTADSGANSTHFWKAQTGEANHIKQFNAGGFRVGNHSNVNSTGNTYYYWALKTASSNFARGVYTGNGSDNRSITGVGFRPDVVIVKRGDTAGEAVMRTSSQASDKSFLMNTAASSVSDNIQEMEADGFQIGTNEKVNANGGTYHYLAFKSDSPMTTTSTSTSTSTTSTSTSTTSTSSSTTTTTSTSSSTSTSTTMTSSSTTMTTTSTTQTTSSTSTSTSSSTSTSTTTTLEFFFSVEEI